MAGWHKSRRICPAAHSAELLHSDALVDLAEFGGDFGRGISEALLDLVDLQQGSTVGLGDVRLGISLSLIHI